MNKYNRINILLHVLQKASDWHAKNVDLKGPSQGENVMSLTAL